MFKHIFKLFDSKIYYGVYYLYVMRFSDSVYSLAKKIPKGKVSTYKMIAEKLGCKAYQAVGNALNKNPYSPIVPCHRIVTSDGRLGGFATGIKNKIKLLGNEGIKIKQGKIIDFENKLYRF